MKQSHGSSLSYLMVSTLENPHVIRGCTIKQSHKINFPMHGGHRIMHLSQKENNFGFSAFKITRKCGFSLFQQGISKNFFFFNDETTSCLLNGTILNLLLPMDVTFANGWNKCYKCDCCYWFG